jgi:hypothetical protein
MAYEVGYGRPPKRTQFKPGQSGNPKGRPHRRVSIEVLLRESLLQRVLVSDHKRGGRRMASLLEVILQQAAQKAALGDPKPLMLILRMVSSLSGLMAKAEAESEDKEERVRREMAKFAEIFGEYVEPDPEGAPPPTQQRPPRKA